VPVCVRTGPFSNPICWLSVDATVEKVADIMMEITK
jgi:hypothetical protein